MDINNAKTLDYSDFINHTPKKSAKFIFYKDHNIKLTENAIMKIEELKKSDINSIIRISVDGGGCQGFQFAFSNDLIENIGQKFKDTILYDDNKKLLIVFDLFSEFYIKNSTINYVSTFLEEGFRIENNPQAKSSCGCKKSFASDVEFEGEVD